MSSKPVSLRLDPDTLARVDALAPRFTTKARDAVRAEILLALIDAGLESVERDGPPRPPRRPADRSRRG